MKTISFVVYLRENFAVVIASMALVPVCIGLLLWLFGYGLLLAGEFALVATLALLLGQYETFGTATGPIDFADFYKKYLVGTSVAILLGYPLFLLLDSVFVIAHSPLGRSMDFLLSVLTILLFYQGRYMGMNGGLPSVKKLFVYLGLPVPSDKR